MFFQSSTFAFILLSFAICTNADVNETNVSAQGFSTNYAVVCFVSHVSWDYGLDYCNEEFGTDLGSIHSRCDRDEMVDLRNDVTDSSSDYIWIGLNDLEHENDGNWSWADDSELDYENWNSGEPNQNDQHCIMAYTNGKWRDLDCDTGNSDDVPCILCNYGSNTDGNTGECNYSTTTEAPTTTNDETTEEPTTTEPFSYVNQSYNVTASGYFNNFAVVQVNKHISWVDGENYCQEVYSSHLASIHSYCDTLEWTILRDILTNNDDRLYCWIGLNDRAHQNDGNWSWSDGSDFDYEYWNSGEPNQNDQHCIMAYDDGSWRDLDCLTGNRDDVECIVCNYGQETNTADSSSTSDDGGCTYPDLDDISVSDDAIDALFEEFVAESEGYSDNYAVTYFGDHVSWLWGEYYCRERFGTNLASIHSINDTDEWTAIRDSEINASSVPYCWIGLNDLYHINDGNWSWIDETDLDYTYWSPGEPNQDDQHCIMAYESGKWRDLDCIHGNNDDVPCIVCNFDGTVNDVEDIVNGIPDTDSANVSSVNLIAMLIVGVATLVVFS